MVGRTLDHRPRRRADRRVPARLVPHPRGAGSTGPARQSRMSDVLEAARALAARLGAAIAPDAPPAAVAAALAGCEAGAERTTRQEIRRVLHRLRPPGR